VKTADSSSEFRCAVVLKHSAGADDVQFVQGLDAPKSTLDLRTRSREV
jgi:hypothetical protein